MAAAICPAHSRRGFNGKKTRIHRSYAAHRGNAHIAGAYAVCTVLRRKPCGAHCDQSGTAAFGHSLYGPVVGNAGNRLRRVFAGERPAWQQHIVDLRQQFKSLHFSRIDVACDTFGKLKLKTIQNYTRKEMYISRWKQYLIQEGVVENSVIWGSAKSDFRLRIYDKTQEREVKSGADPAEIPRDWVRCEFQLRNQAAESFIRSWLDCGDIGSTYRGIMRNQLLYVKCYDGKNRDRSMLARWWDKLLEDSEQIKMAYNVGKDYNFDSLKRYIFHQAGSSIQAYISICGGDVDSLLAGVYGAKLNDRQRELMRTMRGSV